MRLSGLVTVAAVFAVCLTLAGIAIEVLVDWIWFSEVGYSEIFLTLLKARWLLFFSAFVSTLAFMLANAWVARQREPERFLELATAAVRRGAPSNLRAFAHARLRLVVGGVAVAGAGLFAVVEMGNWDVLLRFVYQVQYGQTDPVFGKDIGFYLFSLPAYVALKNWMMLTIAFCALCVGGVYWARGQIEVDQRFWMAPPAVAHLSALLCLFFAVKAWSYFLDRFLLLYDDNGVVVGASYTGVHVELPILWVQIGLAVIAAVVALTNVWARSYRRPIAAAVLVFGSAFVLAEVFPALFERFFVRPNELRLEKPFLQQNITLTRQAFNLQRTASKAFPVAQDLSLESLQANRATIDNIRLWDEQPLMATFGQLQEIRTYYKFGDVDIDRYWLDGTYRQVMLSVRELKTSLLSPNAQTWVNRHVIFTHGNGVTMSPVTRKSAEGMPEFYLQNIPPIATGGPPIREPRIYYGELTDSYVIVKGSTPEFDYPKGKDNAYAWYDGVGGVALAGPVRRMLFAWYFSDPNILISSYITDDSRILFRRNIRQRVETVAPFLRLDHNPYPVISDGRIFWIQDAYTTSDYFPYATDAAPSSGADFNYIRNSVKVVVDAYNGSIDFYVVDRSDAIAATYERIFPGLFKPLAAMPQDLQRHIRYPEDLFFVQAQMYRAYHMSEPEVFYNREDLWQFPRQAADANSIMAPYYMIMRLPGEQQAENILMLPMVPSQRENMIAWLAARCDPPHYGELIAYEFPKEKLIYGPYQIEARINQNTSISQQLSLWNQLGSRVIRGNLHVIPIENSILYVSPLYLRAATGQIPELKRVIAAYGDQVVMEETLARALSALFGGSAPAPPYLEMQAGGTHEKKPERGREALDHYNRAMEKLKAGDWSGFGTELDNLRTVLESLNQLPNDR